MNSEKTPPADDPIKSFAVLLKRYKTSFAQKYFAGIDINTLSSHEILDYYKRHQDEWQKKETAIFKGIDDMLKRTI